MKLNKTQIKAITKMMSEFIFYVGWFYNAKTGVHPIKGMTNTMVLDAVQKYINSLNDDITWGGGDSLDRERVRDIILADNGLEIA
jgi:hypothetical protein